MIRGMADLLVKLYDLPDPASAYRRAESGFAYAMIGCSGADGYYRHTVGAVPIEGSDPGPYRNWLRD